MKSPYYVSTAFLSPLNALLAEVGVSLHTLLASQSATMLQIDNPTEVIDLHDFVDCLEQAAKHIPNGAIALRLAKQQSLSILGPLCVKLQHCSNIEEAISLVVHHIKVLVSGVNVHIDKQENMLQIRYSCSLATLSQSRQLQDYLLATALHTLRELIGHPFPIRACFFTREEHRSTHIKQYAEYFGCAIAFGAPSLAITIDNKILNQPIDKHALAITSRINHAIDTHQDMLIQVKNMISICLATGHHDLETVARALGYHPRTLQRRLFTQDVKYSQLLDSVRIAHCNQYKQNQHLNQTDIAMLLGFKHLSAFSRAFKKWYRGT